MLPYIVIFLFGITVGSFLNVCILRLPKKESIVAVPSHCVNCGKRLRPLELVPLFSYLCLRGRCAGCKARISAQYPIVEVANGLLWCVLYWHFGASADLLFACALCSALLVMAVVDGRTRVIPPGTTVFILVLGALRLLLHLGDWPLYAIGFFAVSAFLLLVLLVTGGRGVGGGDVKLMAACGLFLGWKLVLLAFFMGCVAGSVVHLSRMAFKKAGRVLALGPYLAFGVLVSLLWGDAILRWYLGLLGL
ncbi:MAG: prepilin peptidase [Clostridiales bacterium]|nr:prepilin peptidase [Clostridiales bacterium]